MLLKDALLAGPGMGAVYRKYVFYQFSKKFVKVVKSKFLYSTVRYVLLKDALLAAPRMGAVYRNSCVLPIFKKVCESCEK